MLHLPSIRLRGRLAIAALVASSLAACTAAPPLPGDLSTRSRRTSPGSPAQSTLPIAATSAPSESSGDAPGDGPPSWGVVEDSDLAATDGEMRDVVIGGPGLVAVGGATNGTDAGRAAIWTSIDGDRWAVVPLEGAAASGRLSSVTPGGPGFVAVGGECCPDRAAVWISADGQTWERVQDQESFEGAIMTSSTSWEGGLVAVGCVVELECTGTAIWTSNNGVEWVRLALSQDIGAAYLGDITSAGPVLVAVGTTDRDQPGPPAIFVSLDAMAWTRADVPSIPISLSSVTASPEGIVAVGTSLDEVSGQALSLVLASPDGATWEAVPSDRFARAVAEDIIVGADGYIVAGRLNRGKSGIAAAWHSADGRTWLRVAPGPEGVMHAVVQQPGGGLVAVGRITEGERSSPGVWISPDD